jgi:tripartite-type tricarboxylate transporter receptor subunit TctC
VIPWAPGGTTDILGRIVAEPLGQALGQPVVVENRTGASGNIGSDVVAKATPDGHTILFGSMSTHAMNHALMRSMPFDGVADFTPLAMLGFAINTMVVHPSVPAQTLAEFITYARANRTGSPMPRPVLARPTTCARRCSKTWRASAWSMCRIAAGSRR